MQWFNGVPFQFNPETGQYTAVQSLIPQAQEQMVTVTGQDGKQYQVSINSALGQRAIMGTDKEAAAKQFDAQAKALGVTPDVLADTSQQHSAIYNPKTGQFQNAPNTNDFTHIYYGPYLNNKDLATAMQQPELKNRPPMLPLTAAKNLNALQAAATSAGGGEATDIAAGGGGAAPQVPAANIVPGISAPGGAPVTFAPGASPQVPMGPQQSNGNGSAVDTALASAAATRQAMGTAAPLPDLGASTGAGFAANQTAIPTTWRNVPGAGYVPRAVPVMPAGLSTADLIRPQMGPPGTPPPMLAARDLGASAIAPPTDEQIAMMNQQLLPQAMTNGAPAPAAPAVPVATAPDAAAGVPSLPPQIVTPADRPLISFVKPTPAPGAIPNVSVQDRSGNVSSIPVTKLPDYLAQPGYTVLPPTSAPKDTSLGQLIAKAAKQVSIESPKPGQREGEAPAQADIPRIAVQHPDGSRGTLPATQIPDILAHPDWGYTVLPAEQPEVASQNGNGSTSP
jgi:hypothetical protein